VRRTLETRLGPYKSAGATVETMCGESGESTVASKWGRRGEGVGQKGHQGEATVGPLRERAREAAVLMSQLPRGVREILADDYLEDVARFVGAQEGVLCSVYKVLAQRP
jgi:hypothetical protein